ncbi:MAG: glycosyltransferase family 4 protein [Phycisphaerales bacterium JB039]
MRYCLVSRELAPFFGAGIGTYAAQMARAMAEAGHEMIVVTGPHAGLDRAADELPGVRIIGAEPPPEAAKLPFHFQRHSAAVRRTLLDLHAEAPLDVIEVPEYYGDGCWALWGRQSAGELAGARILCHLHMTTALCRTLNEERQTNLETLGMQAAERETIRLADALVSPSAALLERTTADLAALGIACPTGAAIPYPFDVEAARRDLGAEGARPADEAPTILFFGRLERRKGPDLLAEAALALLDDFPTLRVRFVGGDTETGPGQSSMRAHLEQIVRDRRDRFDFVDRIARGRLGAEIARAAVVCLPSRWDNFPNALLEAMSLAAPCVVTGAGGMGEIVEDGVSGLACEPDPGALAPTLGRALTSPELRSALGAGARQRIETLCDPQTVIEARVAHMAQLASPPAPPRRRAGAPRIGSIDVEEPDWYQRARAAGRGGALLCLMRSREAVDERFALRCAAAIARSGAAVATACSPETAPVGLDPEAIGAAEWSGPVVVTPAALEAFKPAGVPDEVVRWALLCEVALRGGQMAVLPEPLIQRARPAPARFASWIGARYPALAGAPAPRPGLLQRLRRRLGPARRRSGQS